MYCRKCDYDLSGLGVGPCPECGLAFDPDDESTFFRVPGRERAAKQYGIIILVLATSPGITNILAYVSFVVARISLGRWPNRWGRDDPTEIAGVVWFYYPAMFALISILPSLLSSIILSYWVWKGRSWGGIARICLPALIVFVLGWSFFAWDPADVWMWMMD